MKIAIVGTHCSGKTSLIGELYQKIEFKNYDFCEEPIRTVGRLQFQVNEDSDDAAQLAMCAIHLRNLSYTNFISDRSLLDLYVYGQTLRNMTPATLEFIKNIWRNNADRYDYLFLCTPEFPLVKDGFRSVNKEWQKKIDDLFNKELTYLKENCILKHCKIITLHGSTKERCKTVLMEVFGSGK